MVILVSECLLGVHCRYDGGTNEKGWLRDLAREHTLIPACAEQLGGLSTPRPPVEWVGDRAFNTEGRDCTKEFLRGAEEVLEIAKRYGCELAILKSRSPSCGNGRIYDGTFSGKLIPGYGATARLLKENGIRVMDEEEAEKYFRSGT